MGNSRIFHDFRPLGVGANQDPDPPPRVGRGPASGRHTEGPFSRSVLAAGVGVQGGEPGFYGRAKAPPAVENAGPLLAGEEGARLWPPCRPQPHFRNAECASTHRGRWGTLGPGAGGGQEAEAGPGPQLGRRLVRGGSLLVGTGRVLSHSSGCLEARGEVGVW